MTFIENWACCLELEHEHIIKVIMSTWNMYVCLSGLVDVVLLDSTGEAVAVSLLHSHSAADSIEVIRTSDCLCRSSREEVSLTVQPEHLRFWIPARRLTL